MALTFIGDMITQNLQKDLQRELNAEQYQRAVEFDSTKYQRSVDDMEKAGINPMVAFSGGGNNAATGGAGATTLASAGGGAQGLIGPLIMSASKEYFKNASQKDLAKFINKLSKPKTQKG